MTNPYRGLPQSSFWSSAVAGAPPGALDPVTDMKFRIHPEDQVATMGSCFAQHISRFLERVGLHYHVTEPNPPDLSEAEAMRRNYRVFSARYGNVYTVRQARQLFDRAYGLFDPVEHIWSWEERYVDAFRPQIEPDGFVSIDQLIDEREIHLSAVRRLFEQSDVIVFTLGLTEAWASTHDSAVYPVAPGVRGGEHDPDRHRFVNFSAGEVIDDLVSLVGDVRAANPRVRILLTVSPVPLIATYERRHVLISNTVSKATLRVAVADVVNRFDFVEYFPSYEIIAGSAASARYFEPDLRSISQIGVDHVMRVLSAHMIHQDSTASNLVVDFGVARAAGPADDDDVVCDEELIEAALEVSGVARPS